MFWVGVNSRPEGPVRKGDTIQHEIVRRNVVRRAGAVPLWVPGGGLSNAQHEVGRTLLSPFRPTCRLGVIWFFRPIKIKNKYYIVYNNSI